jgi:hypothetical protein
MFILSYTLFKVEIFSTFISIQPEKVPRTPYLSAFIAFATSLAVTKPMNFFFFLEQETKIAKKLHFLYFSESNFFFFVTFGFQKIDNENYFIQCKRNQSGNFKGFIEWLQQANPDVICLQEIKATEDQILLKLLQMRAIRINIIILQPKGIQRCSNFV